MLVACILLFFAPLSSFVFFRLPSLFFLLNSFVLFVTNLQWKNSTTNQNSIIADSLLIHTNELLSPQIDIHHYRTISIRYCIISIKRESMSLVLWVVVCSENSLKRESINVVLLLYWVDRQGSLDHHRESQCLTPSAISVQYRIQSLSPWNGE